MLKELSLTSYQLDEIVHTFSVEVTGMKHYLDAENGDIVMMDTYASGKDAEDFAASIEAEMGNRYFLIPHKSMSEGSSDVYDFTNTVRDTAFRDELKQVLRGRRNVFRKYKDLLMTDAEELERYYDFCETKDKQRVLAWLESVGMQAKVENN